MDEYLQNLYFQYRKANGNSSIMDDQTIFFKWLFARNQLTKKYAEFLVDLGLTSLEIVELNKGIADSVCETLDSFGFDTKAISRYYTTFSGRVNSGVGLIYIEDENPYINDNQVHTLLTHFPISENLMTTLKRLAGNDTEVVVGAYGNSLDNDKEDNLKKLKLYKELLLLFEDIDVKSKFIDNGDIYMGTVMSKPKQYLLDKYALKR